MKTNQESRQASEVRTQQWTIFMPLTEKANEYNLELHVPDGLYWLWESIRLCGT